MEPVIISWSGGKDSALALWKTRLDSELSPVGLLTVVTEGYERVSMHGVRRELVEAQASALGMRLIEVWIPKECSNEEYEARMAVAVARLQEEGIKGFVFGDIYLEEVRKYREEKLLKGGLRGYFPLWGESTEGLVKDFIGCGFRAIVVCVNGNVLDRSFVGREIDEEFMRDLPSGVDFAGENGEYHCFVYDGPIFEHPVAVRRGGIVQRGNFYYIDLIPQRPWP